MKVDYTVTPAHDIRIFPVSSRIITENLLRNPKLEPHFSSNILTSNLKAHRDVFKYRDQMYAKNQNLGECYIPWSVWISNCRATIEYSKDIITSMHSNTLLYGSYTVLYDLIAVSNLLKENVRVVFGGPSTRTASNESITETLKELGVTEQQLKNFIVVRGIVDLSTDLHKIIEDWKDTTITENDYSTIWDCHNSYIQDLGGITEKMFDKFNLSYDVRGHHSVFMFDNACYWGKCKFCTFPEWQKMTNMDFANNVSTDRIVEHVMKTVDKTNTNKIFIANDYFVFRRNYEDIIRELSNNGLRIEIMNGIHLLKDEKYTKKLAKYIECDVIGLESCCDSSLDLVNKGYRFGDVEKAVDNIIEYFDRDMYVKLNIILDLPAKNEEVLLKGYENLLSIKTRLKDAGFNNSSLSPNSLLIGHRTKQNFTDVIREVPDDDPMISGRNYILGVLKDHDITPDIYNKFSLSFVRVDENGKDIPTDFDLIPTDLYSALFKEWGR